LRDVEVDHDLSHALEPSERELHVAVQCVEYEPHVELDHPELARPA
jgi:hypothetical protein